MCHNEVTTMLLCLESGVTLVSATVHNNPAKLNFGIDTTADDIYVQLFEGLFSANLLDLMVTEMNKKISGDPLTYGELLKWIGLCVLMSTVDGSDRWSFWSTRDIDIFHGAPFHLMGFMSRN